MGRNKDVKLTIQTEKTIKLRKIFIVSKVILHIGAQETKVRIGEVTELFRMQYEQMKNLLENVATKFQM